MPRIQGQTISTGIAFKDDFFGEVLPSLRYRVGYEEHVKARGKIVGTDDIRDQNAITRLAAGYVKLLFPDLKLSRSDLTEYCLRPAVSLRRTVRNQLSGMDPEYKPFFMSTE